MRSCAIYMYNILTFNGQTKEQHHVIVVWDLDIFGTLLTSKWRSIF